VSDGLGTGLGGVVVRFDGSGRICNAIAFVGVAAVVARCDVLHNSMEKAMLMAGLRCICMRVGSRVG
jgi:hypothetical protein